MQTISTTVSFLGLELGPQDIADLGADIGYLDVQTLWQFTPAHKAAITSKGYKALEQPKHYPQKLALMTVPEIQALSVETNVSYDQRTDSAKKNSYLIKRARDGLRAFDDLTDDQIKLFDTWTLIPPQLIKTDTKGRLAGQIKNWRDMKKNQVQELGAPQLEWLITQQINSLCSAMHGFELSHAQIQLFNQAEINGLGIEARIRLIRIENTAEISRLQNMNRDEVQSIPPQHIGYYKNPLEFFGSNCNYFTDDQWKEITPYHLNQKPELINLIDPKNIPKLRQDIFEYKSRNHKCSEAVFDFMTPERASHITPEQRKHLQPCHFHAFANKGEILESVESHKEQMRIAYLKDEDFAAMDEQSLREIPATDYLPYVQHLDNLASIANRFSFEYISLKSEFSSLENGLSFADELSLSTCGEWMFEDNRNCSKFINELSIVRIQDINIEQFGSRALEALQPDHIEVRKGGLFEGMGHGVSPDIHGLDANKFQHFNSQFAVALLEDPHRNLSTRQIMNLDIPRGTVIVEPRKNPFKRVERLIFKAKGIEVVKKRAKIKPTTGNRAINPTKNSYHMARNTFGCLSILSGISMIGAGIGAHFALARQNSTSFLSKLHYPMLGLKVSLALACLIFCILGKVYDNKMRNLELQSVNEVSSQIKK